MRVFTNYYSNWYITHDLMVKFDWITQITLAFSYFGKFQYYTVTCILTYNVYIAKSRFLGNLLKFPVVLLFSWFTWWFLIAYRFRSNLLYILHNTQFINKSRFTSHQMQCLVHFNSFRWFLLIFSDFPLFCSNFQNIIYIWINISI